MINTQDIESINWTLFIVNGHPFIDCWVNLNSGVAKKFRYHSRRPRLDGIYSYLPWVYDYFIYKGSDGIVNKSDIPVISNMINDWYKETLINN